MRANSSFDTIQREFAALNFSLEYRVALVEGEIRENKNISDAVFKWLEKVCQLYLESEEKVRNEIRDMFDDDDKLWHLFMFIDKLQTSIRGKHDSHFLERALVALSIEDARFDRRDFTLKLNALLRTARNAGIESKSLLLKIANLSTPATQEFFRSMAG